MATELNQIELYFEWYIQELKEAGFIKVIKREPFSLDTLPQHNLQRYDFKTKKPKIEEFKLIGKHTYTFDYIIIWNKHAKELFYNLIDATAVQRIWCPFYAMEDADGEHVSMIDVKPPAGAMQFGNNTTSYTFPIIQKMLYSLFGIYVNKAIPIPMMSRGKVKSGNNMALFTTTFIPKRYFLTDGLGQARVINFKKRTLQEYLAYKTREIDRINAVLSVQTTLL